MDPLVIAPLVRKHSVTTRVLHVVWSTASRSHLLAPAIDVPLARFLRRKASELQCCVLAAGDHVHLVVQHHPAMTVAELVGRLKGAWSREASVAHGAESALRWQVGYWAESVSASQIGQLARYLAAQRAHHEQADALEPWQERWRPSK